MVLIWKSCIRIFAIPVKKWILDGDFIRLLCWGRQKNGAGNLGKEGIISRYFFDETVLNTLNIKEFESYSEEWLDFILACRNGKDIWKFDIVIGGVANDKVFNTIELYLDQLIDKTEAIRRLRYEKPNLQVCFRTQEAIDRYLRFEGSERV